MLIVAEADHAAVPLAERAAMEDAMEAGTAFTDVCVLPPKHTLLDSYPADICDSGDHRPNCELADSFLKHEER